MRLFAKEERVDVMVMYTRLKACLKDRCGAAALEFALVSIPFIWLVMVIFETGILFFVTRNVEYSTEQAARFIRTGQADNGGWSKATFKDNVCASLFTFLDCGKLYIDVRTYSSFASVNVPEAVMNGELSEDITENAKYEIGSPYSIVVVRSYYVWPLFTPGISLLSNVGVGSRVIAAAAAFRNEPYR